MKAYTLLLHFFIKVTILLTEANHMNKLRESFKSGIPQMVSDFSNVTKHLDTLFSAEQFALVMEMKAG